MPWPGSRPTRLPAKTKIAIRSNQSRSPTSLEKGAPPIGAPACEEHYVSSGRCSDAVRIPGANRVAINVPPSIAALDFRYTAGSPASTLISICSHLSIIEDARLVRPRLQALLSRSPTPRLSACHSASLSVGACSVIHLGMCLAGRLQLFPSGYSPARSTLSEGQRLLRGSSRREQPSSPPVWRCCAALPASHSAGALKGRFCGFSFSEAQER